MLDRSGWTAFEIPEATVEVPLADAIADASEDQVCIVGDVTEGRISGT